jgi:hypothetical protein
MNTTTTTYALKREVLSFCRDLSKGAAMTHKRFTADMVYGITASGNCILSKIADTLQEPIHKSNTIDRLSRHLMMDMPQTLERNYRNLVKGQISPTGNIFVDDSDIIKPYGQAFEDLDRVRDGSSKDKKIENGYHVTEVCALLDKEKQPVSLYSRIYSSISDDFISSNVETQNALLSVFRDFPDATYVFDRGYDANDHFRFMYQHKKQFIVRIKENRIVYNKGRRWDAVTLRDSHKGKINVNVMFEGKDTPCYVSHMNVRITADRHPLRLLLIYGLTQTPMMLVTNKAVKGKEDVEKIVRSYFSRWRIEEYFRFKKQHYGFEGFRVRSLKAINALNRYVSFAIALLGMLSQKGETSQVKQSILDKAMALKNEVSFYLYRYGYGVIRILAQAHEGIRGWFRKKWEECRQLEMRLVVHMNR